MTRNFVVRLARGFASAASMALLIAPAMHAQGRRGAGAPPVVDPNAASITDSRVGLRAGMEDAGISAHNLMLVGHQMKPDTFNHAGGLTYANSDMAFRGNFLYQGNFDGFSIWDISNPMHPVLRKAYPCTTGQGDPSIYGNLLFISSEGKGDRTDCSAAGIRDSVSTDRSIGVRIFDVSDPDNPRKVADVQTCRGSHTHTIVPDPTDKGIIYIYVSGSSAPRSATEMPGCLNYSSVDSTNSALFRIEIIRVPLAHPEQAKVVTTARVFDNLVGVRGHGNVPGDTLGRGRGGRGRLNNTLAIVGDGGAMVMAPPAMATMVIDSIVKARGGSSVATHADTAKAVVALTGRAGVFAGIAAPPVQGAAGAPAGRAGRGAGAPGGGRGNADPNAPRPGPNQCHDITVYPAVGLAGGACGGLGLLVDIHDPLHPKRLDFAGDSNFSFWHSATFSNDGSKVLFSDEWGGGQQPKCRAIDPLNWGGDAIFTIKNGKLTQHAYFKMPAAQTEQENCVAHNGSLVPVPGRDILVQGWYQGGIDVFDWSDPDHPREIAFFDRGPIPDHPERPDSQSTAMVTGGYWAGYWYNGHIYGSEIVRGIDVFDLQPSEWLSQNEIDAAKLVHMEQFNPQEQPKLVWPAAFPVVRSYLDQLVRNNGLPRARTLALGNELDAAQKATGAARKAALTRIAAALDGDAAKASDAQRVKWMAQATRDLAAATK